MGGPRASTIRRIERGAICCKCHSFLPERDDGGFGVRLCQRCMEADLVTVVMSFTFDLATDKYHVHFLERDGMTALPWTGRYATQEPLLRIVLASYQPMSAEREIHRKLVTVRRGTVRLRITAEQYARLKRQARGKQGGR